MMIVSIVVYSSQLLIVNMELCVRAASVTSARGIKGSSGDVFKLNHDGHVHYNVGTCHPAHEVLLFHFFCIIIRDT